MKEPQDRITNEFLSNLLSYLNGAGETALERGYSVGREAVDEGFGVLKIVEAYVSSLNEILSPLSPEAAETVSGTREFLAACLAPFEMTHRGYRDSISRLQKLNRSLESQTQELAAVNRELEAFSSSVSHDLRAPVRAIRGFSEILLQDHRGGLSPEAQVLLSRIVKSAVAMSGLIDGLLSLSRYGHQALYLEPVNLSELAQEVLDELKEAHPNRRVQVQIAPKLVTTGDHELLRVVLFNLLANAWKFTARTEHAKIEFEKTLVEGQEAFVVRDNGSGFDMKHTQNLFAPFARLHSKEEFEGTGIGLATVERIIQRHGGRIWAQAQVGQGAQFYFTIGAK